MSGQPQRREEEVDGLDAGEGSHHAAQAVDQEGAAQRIRFLRHIAPISEFYFARHTRDYGRMAYLLARHVSVQREAVGKVFNLLRR